MDLTSLADQIRQQRERNRAMDTLADALDQIGNLDSATQESRNRLEKAKADEGEATARLTVLLQNVKDQQAGLDAREAAANEKAAGIVAAAEERANKLEQDAASDREAKKAQAAQEAQAIIDQARQQAQESMSAKAAADIALDAANQQLAAANAELADVQGRLAAAKGEIARLLGK